MPLFKKKAEAKEESEAKPKGKKKEVVEATEEEIDLGWVKGVHYFD